MVSKVSSSSGLVVLALSLRSLEVIVGFLGFDMPTPLPTHFPLNGCPGSIIAIALIMSILGLKGLKVGFKGLSLFTGSMYSSACFSFMAKFVDNQRVISGGRVLDT